MSPRRGSRSARSSTRRGRWRDNRNDVRTVVSPSGQRISLEPEGGDVSSSTEQGFYELRGQATGADPSATVASQRRSGRIGSDADGSQGDRGRRRRPAGSGAPRQRNRASRATRRRKRAADLVVPAVRGGAVPRGGNGAGNRLSRGSGAPDQCQFRGTGTETAGTEAGTATKRHICAIPSDATSHRPNPI